MTTSPHDLNPYTLPATTHSYLLRAAESLSEAIAADDVATRYACAHVAALRAAAALLAARARPTAARRRPQKNAWVLLAGVAPGLREWASFFAAGASKRAAAEIEPSRAMRLSSSALPGPRISGLSYSRRSLVRSRGAVAVWVMRGLFFGS